VLGCAEEKPVHPLEIAIDIFPADDRAQAITIAQRDAQDK